MRKLVLSMFVSLDGYINAAGGEFVGPDWSADLDGWTDSMLERFDTLIYGRTSWEKMAGFWPPALDNPDLTPATKRLARFMNDSRKIVLSRTLADCGDWANSTLANGPLAEVVAREKQKQGKDIALFAGAVAAQSALREGLVDEIWLLTIPALFGHGTRLFEGHGPARSLRLIEGRPLDTGAILARYDVVPAGPPANNS